MIRQGQCIFLAYLQYTGREGLFQVAGGTEKRIGKDAKAIDKIHAVFYILWGSREPCFRVPDMLPVKTGEAGRSKENTPHAQRRLP